MNQSEGPLKPQGQEPRDEIRERLLNAAEQLFCQKGFDVTSVRDLTNLAGCNVAAVNYYFGDKKQLYTEMFRRQVQGIVAQDFQALEEVMAGPSPSLEELLRRIIAPPLKAAFRNEPPATGVRLIIREVLNQHVDMEAMTKDLRELYLPRMSEALRRLVPGLDEVRSELAVFSLDAMTMHPLLFMPIYMAWIKGLDLELLIDHTVQYTASAIREMAKGNAE
jgi:TetR/AcrR family transcriptional regulator, regulator of cefoperazone and chloramphenicol sensitivity